MKQRIPVSGFVLVGGESRRMGSDKALLAFQGAPLLLRAARIITPYVESVTLLGSPARYSHYGLTVLADEYPQAGPLGGIATGLRHSPSEWNLFFACDLPLIDASVMQQLLDRLPTVQGRALVPRTKNGWQPLCAIYHRDCLPVMEKALARREFSIRKLFSALSVDEITATGSEDSVKWEHQFLNINTSEEWERLQGETGAPGGSMKEAEHFIGLAAKDGETRSGMILGIRMALAGLAELGIADPAEYHRDLVIYVETDRCLPDAIELVTGCRLGNRALKFRDMGKMAAVFLDRRTGRAVRIAAKESGHQRAQEIFASLDKEAALQAGYGALPECELFAKQEVRIALAPEDVPGYWAPRVRCDACGEGIAFGRELLLGQKTLCRSCAGQRYYEPLVSSLR